MSTELAKKSDTAMEEAAVNIVDILIAWKRDTDDYLRKTEAARFAITQAKELQIWIFQGYKSFKEWLEQETGITEVWAYRLIKSAKLINDVEEAAMKSKHLAPLVRSKKKRQTLHALPDKAFSQLSRLSPKQAAKAALNAIEEAAGDIPTIKQVAAEVEKFTPATKKKTENWENHPVLIAFDNEQTAIEKDLGLMDLKPKAIMKRLRTAIEKVL